MVGGSSRMVGMGGDEGGSRLGWVERYCEDGRGCAESCEERYSRLESSVAAQVRLWTAVSRGSNDVAKAQACGLKGLERRS